MRHESFQAFLDSGCGAHSLCDLNSPAMNRFARRVLIGGAAGAIGTFFLASALPCRMIAVGLGLVLGAAFALGMLPAREGYVDRLMSGAAMGISLWGLISVIGIPLLSGTMPEWGAAQMRTHLPALVGWITYGASYSLRIGRWRCQSGFYKSITSRARLLLVLEASLTKDNDSYEWDRSGCTALDNYIGYDFDTSAVACGMVPTTHSCGHQNTQTS